MKDPKYPKLALLMKVDINWKLTDKEVNFLQECYIKKFAKETIKLARNRTKLFSVMMVKLSDASREKVEAAENFKTYEDDADVLRLLTLIITIYVLCGIKGKVKAVYKLKQNFSFLKQKEPEMLHTFKLRFNACISTMIMSGEPDLPKEYLTVCFIQKLSKKFYSEAINTYDNKYKTFTSLAEVYDWVAEYTIKITSILPTDNTSSIIINTKKQHHYQQGNLNVRGNSRAHGSRFLCNICYQLAGNGSHMWRNCPYASLSHAQLNKIRQENLQRQINMLNLGCGRMVFFIQYTTARII